MNPLRLTVVPQLLSTFTDLSSNKPVTPKQVPSIWNQCLEQVDMATLVRLGFSQTGLYPCESNVIEKWNAGITRYSIIKRPTRDACLCMGELPAPHFVFLITL